MPTKYSFRVLGAPGFSKVSVYASNTFEATIRARRELDYRARRKGAPTRAVWRLEKMKARRTY